MAARIYHPRKYYLATLTLAVFFLLVSCDNKIFKKSAQELTGGNGAGLSGYQVTPTP